MKAGWCWNLYYIGSLLASSAHPTIPPPHTTPHHIPHPHPHHMPHTHHTHHITQEGRGHSTDLLCSIPLCLPFLQHEGNGEHLIAFAYSSLCVHGEQLACICELFLKVQVNKQYYNFNTISLETYALNYERSMM